MQFTYPSLIRADMSSDWVVGNMDHKLMYWDWWTHNASKLEKDGSAEKINAPQSVAPHAQLKRGQNHAYNSLKMLHGGHQCHEKNYTSLNEVSTWQNHNNNWNGKSKREKGTPSQRFLFYVTTRLCHWHCAWGLCGLGKCWWERQCQRSWPSCAAVSYSSATVWAFVFVGMVCVRVRACVCVCVGLCKFACVCLHVYVEERFFLFFFLKKCVHSAVACIQYACISLLSTQTHTAWFLGTWDKTGPVFVALFFSS